MLKLAFYNIHFTMTRYNDILNKMNIKYKLTASELEEITYDDIKLKLYESKKQRKNIAVQDIIFDWGKDIEKIDNSTVTDLHNYKLEFETATGYNLTIARAKVIYNNAETGQTEEVLDLMEPIYSLLYPDQSIHYHFSLSTS